MDEGIERLRAAWAALAPVEDFAGRGYLLSRLFAKMDPIESLRHIERLIRERNERMGLTARQQQAIKRASAPKGGAP